MRSLLRHTALAALVGIMVLTAPEVTGQTVSGVVLDSETRAGIEAATVAVIDAAGVEIASAISSQDGRFEILVRAGTFRAFIRHVAYQQITSNEFVLAPNHTLHLEAHLDPAPHLMEQITVTDTQPRAAEQGRYYGRRAMGIGRFISRDDIVARGARFVTDMLEGIPGIRVNNGDFGVVRNTVARGCYPTVVLDDVVMRRRGQQMGIRLDDLIRPQDVEAIEVYARGTGLPAQYGGRESPCGAILIWSRR